LNRYLAWFLTFNYVNITLIFFRSKTIESSIDIIKGMTGLNEIEWNLLLDKDFFLILIFLLAVIITFCFKNSSFLVENYFNTK